MIRGVNLQHFRFHRIALLEHFAWVFDPPRPADVAHVDQSVKPFLNFEERAKLGQVADAAGDLRADRIFFCEFRPRIGLSLRQAEGNAPMIRSHLKHHHVHGIADLHQLRRMLFPLRPAHLRNVHQTFDSGVELDEGAIVRGAHHPALYARAHGESLRHRRPGIGKQLPPPQGNPHLLSVELQDLHFQLFARPYHVSWVRHPAPGQVGNVEQPVETAQVDEDPVTRNAFTVP